MTPRNSALIDEAAHHSFTPYTPSQAEQRLRLLERAVAALLARIQQADWHAEGFAEVAHLLEVVLLPASDFCLAKRHLDNSSHYCQAGEYGAGAFELRVVRGILLRL